MSYPDTLSRLEGQVRQLEDARMQEARERDQLRSEVNRLRAALKRIVDNRDNKNWRKPEMVQEAEQALR